jgi:hypothetical protein
MERHGAGNGAVQRIVHQRVRISRTGALGTNTGGA